MDNSRVTCVKWVPGSEHCFISAHRSGNLYVWTTENHANGKVTTPTTYVPHKETLDTKISTVKQKTKCPLLFRWTVGYGPINAVAFSPDAIHIAISSQDGFLRVYDFHKQEMCGRMRSYFGGLLCVCWSPDGKYVVTGGEDDLVTVWSFEHKKVVARGEGHQSYVNAVAFDPHMTVLPSSDVQNGVIERTGEGVAAAAVSSSPPAVQTQAESSSAASGELNSESRSTATLLLEKAGTTLDSYTAYRLGSIGQDTQICLWDLSGDSLKIRRHITRGRSRMSRQSRPVSMVELGGLEPGSAATTTGTTTARGSNPQETPANEGANEAGGSNEKGEGAAATGGSGKGGGERESSLIPNHFGSNPNLETESNHTSSAIANQNPELSLPVDLLRRKESSPSVSVSSTSSVSSKKEKKRKKDKDKDKPKKEKSLKPHRSTLKDPVRKVIKFVGSGFTASNPSSSHTRRPVGSFETCNSDDIAPKMHEVNLVEPLVAKKISQERLTALVFREDCILTACHEGFISTWARPNVCMSSLAEGGREEEEEKAGLMGGAGRPPPASSNPGVSECVCVCVGVLYYTQ